MKTSKNKNEQKHVIHGKWKNLANFKQRVERYSKVNDFPLALLQHILQAFQSQMYCVDLHPSLIN